MLSFLSRRRAAIVVSLLFLLMPEAVHGQDVMELLRACKKGPVKRVEKLLDRGMDVDQSSPEGITCLSIAAYQGNLSIAELVLERGADVELGPLGVSPLMSAGWTGRADVARLLLQHGAKAWEGQDDGWTPLLLAGYWGYSDMVPVLVEAGADVNRTASVGAPAEIETLNAEGGHPPDPLKRPSSGKAASYLEHSALMLAAAKGHLDTVRVLLEQGADPRAKSILGQSAVGVARRAGHQEIVRLLETATERLGSRPLPLGPPVPERCGDPSDPESGEDALILAVARSQPQRVLDCLARGVDPDIRNEVGNRPLTLVRTLATLRVLLDGGADVEAGDGKGSTLLHGVAQRADPEASEILDALIASGANVNAKDHEGYTPLILAAMTGQIDHVRTLLQAGAEVDLRNDQEESALTVVGRSLFLEPEVAGAIVGALLEAGADPRQDFLLLQAAKDVRADKVTELIGLGVDPNVRDESGRTPLMWAALGWDRETIEELLRAGADIDARDGEGETAITLAVTKNRRAIIDLLEEAGASLPPDHALRRAVATGDLETVERLVGEGVDPDRSISDGKILVHLAAARPSPEVLQALLEAGANPDLADAQGRTALHVAALEGREGSVRALIDAGAAVNPADEAGRVPLDLVSRKAPPGLAEALRGAGGRPSESASVARPGAAVPSTGATGGWSTGDRVLGRWGRQGRYWYPGTVTGREGERYLVRFGDGDVARLEASEMVPETLGVGDRIFGNWKGRGIYYPGMIAERSGREVLIHYDDGDVERTTLSFVRVQMPEPPSRATP